MRLSLYPDGKNSATHPQRLRRMIGTIFKLLIIVAIRPKELTLKGIGE
jgi:hypothetical protein